MEDGFFDIRLRDGWALFLLVGIGGMIAWNCQSESSFSFFMTVSASGSRGTEKRGTDDPANPPVETETKTATKTDA